MTEIRFDTAAMIDIGLAMRDYHGVTDPVAKSFGTVPAGLPPDIAADVTQECHRLEGGVRSLGKRTEALGAFSVAVAERAKAADSEGGDSATAQKMLTIAFLNLPTTQLKALRNLTVLEMGQTLVKGLSLESLKQTWPDVFDAMDDLDGSKAADDLMRHLTVGGVKNLDVIEEYAKRGETPPARLRALDSSLRGINKITPWLERAGVGVSVVSQFFSDLGRKDLTFASKIARAGARGAFDFTTGRIAASGAERLILARVGTGAIKGPWGLAATGLSVVAGALGAEGLSKVLGGDFLFEPNPNDAARAHLPPAERSRIETESRNTTWADPDYIGTAMSGDEMDHFHALSDRARVLDEKIRVQYEAYNSRTPVDPDRFRRMADDLLRTLDERRDLGAAMQKVVDGD